LNHYNDGSCNKNKDILYQNQKVTERGTMLQSTQVNINNNIVTQPQADVVYILPIEDPKPKNCCETEGCKITLKIFGSIAKGLLYVILGVMNLVSTICKTICYKEKKIVVVI